MSSWYEDQAEPGSEEWTAAWQRLSCPIHNSFTDELTYCSKCRVAALVVWCIHRRDWLEDRNIERWCACPKCGLRWREATSIIETDPSTMRACRLARISSAIADALRQGHGPPRGAYTCDQGHVRAGDLVGS